MTLAQLHDPALVGGEEGSDGRNSAARCTVDISFARIIEWLVVAVALVTSLFVLIFVVSLVLVIVQKNRLKRAQIRGFEVQVSIGNLPVPFEDRKSNDHG